MAAGKHLACILLNNGRHQACKRIIEQPHHVTSHLTDGVPAIPVRHHKGPPSQTLADPDRGGLGTSLHPHPLTKSIGLVGVLNADISKTEQGIRANY